MEDKRPAQTPERELAKPADATAARTRPTDAAASPPADADDAADARRGASDADAATKEMAARGFGSHKGTEAD
ncbi:hypothetical protein GCM10011404_11200 [Sphingomonas prati]|uniref:Uncharacterized protein n=2 Tax=Sphingomonas prati TaxID=1843237 RepID=A0A7W9F008_9SPHN|nr:hypothetical protein [Sphingomonas prati]MBB5727728.1 hypothetical protein [Sphingomonas prati]GGE80281.1 hypothetical protein GCM10011404_11200 [Sphingomonas prati]